MKKTLFTLLAAAGIIVLSGCGGAEAKAEDHAEEMCECLQEGGLNGSLSYLKLMDRKYMRELEEQMEEKVPKCILGVMRKMEKDMDDMSKKEKKEYTKAYMKSAIDTECADILLDMIPYDMLGMALDQMEKGIERQEEHRERRNSRDDIDELEDLFR